RIDFDERLAERASHTECNQPRLRPKPELYAKANDALRLLRELGRMGELEVTCGYPSLPHRDAIEPEGAYFDWTIKLKTDGTEAAVREIFEFVECDGDLEVRPLISGFVEAPEEAEKVVKEVLAQVAAEEQAEKAVAPVAAAPVFEVKP